MKWFKRGCWLAAWGVWAWLGVGLHRELPRHFGREICALPLQQNEVPWGFIAGREIVVTCESHYIQGHFRSWDARTGRLLYDWCGSTMGSKISVKKGLVVGVDYNEVATDLANAQCRTADLSSGDRTPFNFHSVGRLMSFHPTKPWAIISESFWLTVVDLKSGKAIDRSPQLLDSNERLVACQFVENSDDVLLLIESTSRIKEVSHLEPVTEQRLVHWTPRGQVGKSIRLGRCYEAVAAEIRGGRLLVLPSKSPAHVAVLDHRTGEAVFDSVEAGGAVAPTPARNGSNPRLSANGRYLAAFDGCIWDVDERGKIWSPSAGFEFVREAGAETDSILVVEQWNKLLGDWCQWHFLRTTAVRDFETGAFRYRVRGEHPRLSHLSSDGRLGIADNRVYEMIPRVDWLLLSVCQLVLALPMLLTWIVLRFRRNRRAAPRLDS